MGKKVILIIIGLLLSYLYFSCIAAPITSIYFRTQYEGVSALMTILIYFVIILPCLLVFLKKIYDKFL